MPKGDVLPDNGEYVLKLQLGNPSTDIYGILDTGSDLFWTQCQPCDVCFKQVHPIYNPKASSTYTDIDCNSEDCHLAPTVFCSETKLCNYTYAYGDDSETNGYLAKETINFGGMSVQDLVFGCGHENTGVFNENEMGIIGLGGAPLSLTSQVGTELGSKKFSFCLVPFHTDPKLASKMYFGAGSEVTGPGVVTTPMVKTGFPTFYYVTLEGISVEDKLLPYSTSSTKPREGNVFLDSGTPPTMLPKDLYNRVAEAVKNAVKLTPYQDPDLGTHLCYKTTSMANDSPVVKFHFAGGGEVPLVHSSIFTPPKDGVFWFTMAPTDDPNTGIIGNFAQSQLRVAFDLDKQTVSFKQADCTETT